MTIIVKNPELIEFGELRHGDIFKITTELMEAYCMKLINVDEPNVVYLHNGDLGYIDSKQKVEKVKHHLVVER